MDAHSRSNSQTSLFQVYLRLRPSSQSPGLRSQQTEPWLIVEPSSPLAVQNELGFEEAAAYSKPTHITLQPPNDSRKRAVEKFGFTKVFQEQSSQIEVFEQTGTVELINNILTAGRDGLVATLGVTGSGKSHTILGSRSERGITQMTLDIIFRSLGCHIRRSDHPELPTDHGLLQALQAADPSEAQLLSANSFLESTYNDGERGRSSRAQTPMIGTRSRAETPSMVWHPLHSIPEERFPGSFPIPTSERKNTPSLVYPNLAVAENIGLSSTSAALTPSIRLLPGTKAAHSDRTLLCAHPVQKNTPKKHANSRVNHLKENTTFSSRRNPVPQLSGLPQAPDVARHALDIDPTAEYVVIVSMYEVYNDRIFDLLSSSLDSSKPQMTTRGAALQKELKRRPLLFKSTEMSPDRKVVAGLRKIVCGNYDEAMMVLETGLMERRVAGTGSNSVSSRSHGFFCIEVKKKSATRRYDDWEGGTLSIVDLAGSERARNAKTAGATLAEAGKINESLMYLGQCLQMQSDCQQEGSKPTLVPFRQCKLTELLFSNSFPSASASHRSTQHPQPQKATMIVTADPLGDFNATSQILRYSALAREVTVPRIPSTTSTHIHPGQQNGRSAHQPSHHDVDGRSIQQLAEDLDAAAAEMARLDAELDMLAMRCAEEEILRREAELRAAAAEEKSADVEVAVREEVWAEMEERIEEERERWKGMMAKERERIEGYVDGKVEIAGRSSQSDLVPIYEDRLGSTPDEELTRENEILKAKILELERELQCRSPTKTTTTRRSSPRKKTSQPQPLGEVRNLSLATRRSSTMSASAADPFTDIVKREDSFNDSISKPFKLSPRVSLSLLPPAPENLLDGTDTAGMDENDVLSPMGRLSLSLSSPRRSHSNMNLLYGGGARTPNRRQSTVSSSTTISSTLPDSAADLLDMDLFGAFPEPPSLATGGGGITVPKTPLPTAKSSRPGNATATPANVGQKMTMTPRTVSQGTAKKTRKLTTRKWDLGDENEID